MKFKNINQYTKKMAVRDENNKIIGIPGKITIEPCKGQLRNPGKAGKKLIEKDLNEPEYFGEEDIEYLLITWGSSYGPAREAFQLLQADGIKVGLLSFNDVWPLPKNKLKNLAERVELVTVEMNSTAQFKSLIASETLLDVEHDILKYSGRPFTGKEIYNRFLDEVIDNG